MGRQWDKFRLLIWKNWLLQRRHKMQTAVEILAPVIFATLMVLVRSLVEPEMADEVNFDSFAATKFFTPSLIGNTTAAPSIPNNIQSFNFTISFSPDTKRSKALITRSMRHLLVENVGPYGYLININRYIVGFPNSKAMMTSLTDPLANETNLCGIEFDDEIIGKDFWPDNVKMTLHFPAELRTQGIQAHFFNWKTNFLFPMFQTPGPRAPKEKAGGWPGYVQEGFMPLAHAIYRELTMEISKNVNPGTFFSPRAMRFPDVEIQRFPHPVFLSDDLLTALQGFISIIIMLSFNYTCINTVKVIATEKERQLKEVMKIMGLDNWLHWTAWFIKAFSYIMITVIFIVILLKVEWYDTKSSTLPGYSVFTFTPWHFIFFFLMIYMATSICFCFMISVFFSRANTAATVAGLMWFLSYAPYMFLSNDQVLPSVATRLGACLASNTAMAFGFEIILANEATAEGLLWSKIWTPTTIDDTLVMGHIIIMLVVDAILYLLIALYVEQVFPGSYGVPQPWYFPVSGEYWRSSFRCMSVVEDIPHDNEELSNDAIEADPKGLNVGINIKNLTKIYNKKVAVDKLTFKIFEDQITVLLGHNGAGKTTTMSMLTGMFPPTSGTATVNGHDIRHDVAGVRDSLGICPQHNVLFADLTVAEHIYFYARLKGVSGSALKEEVNKYVSLLDLENKRDVISNSLSGGMQRRLSVGAALCGGSKVVLLDEPSSGMDPSARRHLWDLLHAEKKGRTVILSTHFMDEAEVLGERVAVLAGGRLRAVGSPFHLKKKFGSGYRLTAATRGLPSAPVTALIRNHIPQATLYSDIGSELCYLLPDDLSGVFEPMLKELELRQDELGLTSFGISATTLEDVFMKVGADAVEIVDDQDQITYKENDSNGVILVDETQKNGHALNENDKCSDIRYTGFRLYMDQWKAMLYKKMVVTLRSWLLSILQLVIPVLFLIIAIMVSRMWQTSVDLPGLDMTISESYTDTVTLVNAPSDADAVTLMRQKVYKQFFADAKIDTLKVMDTGSKTIDEFYLKQAEYDMPQMRVRNLAGATFSNSSNVKVWFSNFAYHDLPVSMMLTHNAILKAESPNSSFTLINKPLPFTLKNQFEMLNYGDNSGFQIAFNIGFSMAFVSAFYVLFYIKENVCRSKLLQLASGASPVILWGSAFLWDLLCFLIIALALCITLAISNESGFATAPEIGRVLLILMVFGWGMLPIHFVASHSFRTPSTGFSRMCLFNIFTGVATFLVVEVLNAPGLDLEHVANILHWIFLLVPNYALCGALKNLYEASITLKGCQAVCDLQNLGSDCNQYTVCQMSPAFERCCISDHPYFDWTKPGVGAHVLYMMVIGIVMFLFLLIKEYRISNELLHCWKKPPPLGGAGEVEDSDVAEEREKVASLPKEEYQNYSLLCKDMSKYYLNFLAVNQISLTVKNGECFGLLGINGAGKTTTFKMLTGDLDISSGGAWVTGHSVAKDMKTVYNSIGYCPQFDALLDEMTGRETLHMFAQLRGIPKLQQQRYVWDLSKRLGFVKHLDKKVREYSGGNKRKLSTSLALLGDPQVVYLDEPTTGMDPMAKRQVWRAVAGRKTGSVVLTSHSMEECEALCTRLAIMVNGRFRCLGSTQHLKNKFSQGYTLIVKLRRLPIAIHAPVSEGAPDLVPTAPPFFPGGAGYQFNTESLHRFLLERFPGAQLKESYQGLITYYLPDTSIMWSTIFGVMEAAKAELDIEDYSIGQTSLEQIFLQFTKDQRAHQDD